jgi:hypothetical protein
MNYTNPFYNVYLFFYRLWHNKLKLFPREVSFAIQRMKYGISKKDTWNLDYYLEYVIVRGLRRLYLGHAGTPGFFIAEDNSPEAFERGAKEWEQILLKMIEGFLAARHLSNGDYSSKPNWKDLEKEYEKKFEEGMRLFTKYFFSLWD